MTSTQIRQSFLDFFKSKQHTIVPSSSLMPDSPNLLFTNAGMNQFVPIFLGQARCRYTPGRAADTQKCIRAGGKHNDLDDVGLDTYHHTFFEMLGNWSFGDYFKKEAIEWAWELVVGIWKFPPQRLYATVYNPDKSKNDPSEFDQEAWNFWAEKFRSVGLDPAIHIVNGNKKDNFWMMGETGPCGPCSELHVDLTPAGDTKGALVNKGSAECIEIWNLVFIQFNANPDGTFSPLPAKHVDTGMGFERVTSIMQGTKGFTDFANARISNYETDIFRPIFDEIEKLSGRKYCSTLPKPGSTGDTEQEKSDVAFRVIGDHIRTLSFAIADGIQPGNTDRNYVLRRILRRAVRYGRTLGFHEPFFYKLVDVLATTMGDVFPEIRTKKNHVEEIIQREEEAFNKTLDTGMELLIHKQIALQLEWNAVNDRVDKEVSKRRSMPDGLKSSTILSVLANAKCPPDGLGSKGAYFSSPSFVQAIEGSAGLLNAKTWEELDSAIAVLRKECRVISGATAFVLYDTYGFPIDLTEILAKENGFSVDLADFEKFMAEQKKRSQAAQKKEVISISHIETITPTKFVGFESLAVPAKVLEVVSVKDKTAVILDTTAAYAEMGGQVGDTGALTAAGQLWRVTNTQKSGNTFLHFVERRDAPAIGAAVTLAVEKPRRDAIQRHHTVTHLLHWALHEVVSKEASQKGSFVGPDKLTFDFNSAPLTPAQVADIEKLVNERIVENAGVSWTEVPYADVKSRKDVMQFFGDKYGDTVRVVQIGGHAQKLDGYSMELCGGTHTRATGEIGLFRIVGENAIAAGVRRIEAVAGLEAYNLANNQLRLLRSVASQLNAPVTDLEKKVEALLAHQKELEKQLKSANQREAANNAKTLLAKAETIDGTPAIIANIAGADGDTLQTIADALKSQFKGVIVLGGAANGAVALVATVSPDFTAKVQAGKIIQTIAPIVGGKGGGKPDNARGGGKDAAKLDEALAKVKSMLG
jgi:alanyl-tRNA synthetase